MTTLTPKSKCEHQWTEDSLNCVHCGESRVTTTPLTPEEEKVINTFNDKFVGEAGFFHTEDHQNLPMNYTDKMLNLDDLREFILSVFHQSQSNIIEELKQFLIIDIIKGTSINLHPKNSLDYIVFEIQKKILKQGQSDILNKLSERLPEQKRVLFPENIIDYPRETLIAHQNAGYNIALSEIKSIIEQLKKEISS